MYILFYFYQINSSLFWSVWILKTVHTVAKIFYFGQECIKISNMNYDI